MAADTDDNIKIIKASIVELRHSHEHISNIYDQLRLKALALIAGEVAIVSFIFGDEKTKIPEESDRKVFFFVGLILLGLSFGALLWIISTVRWKLPHDFAKANDLLSDKNRNTEIAFFKCLHDDFCDVNEHNNKIVSNKCKKFNWVVYALSAGVIILMVMKFAGVLE